MIPLTIVERVPDGPDDTRTLTIPAYAAVVYAVWTIPKQLPDMPDGAVSFVVVPWGRVCVTEDPNTIMERVRMDHEADVELHGRVQSAVAEAATSELMRRIEALEARQA